MLTLQAAYVVLYHFEDLVDCKVLRRLEPPGLPRPGQWGTLLTVGFELQQRVVYAVKQNLVVDVLTLS
jgi:hypothetical protein